MAWDSSLSIMCLIVVNNHLALIAHFVMQWAQALQLQEVVVTQAGRRLLCSWSVVGEVQLLRLHEHRGKQVNLQLMVLMFSMQLFG